MSASLRHLLLLVALAAPCAGYFLGHAALYRTAGPQRARCTSQADDLADARNAAVNADSKLRTTVREMKEKEDALRAELAAAQAAAQRASEDLEQRVAEAAAAGAAKAEVKLRTMVFEMKEKEDVLRAQLAAADAAARLARNELGEMKRELKDVKNRAEEVTRVVRQERDELAEQLRRRELDDENARNAGADSKLRTTVREMKQIEDALRAELAAAEAAARRAGEDVEQRVAAAAAAAAAAAEAKMRTTLREMKEKEDELRAQLAAPDP